MIRSSVFVLLCCFILTVSPGAEVLIDPPSAVLAPAGDSFRVEFTNSADDPLEIDFLPSSGEILVRPSSLSLEGGASASIEVENRGAALPEGSVILMISDREDLPYLYSLLPSGAASGQTAPSADDGSMLFFHTPGCSICDTFYEELVPELEQRLGVVLEVERLNVFDPGSFELLRGIAAERGVVIRDFPALVTEGRIYLGEKQIFHDFPAALEGEGASLPESAGVASGSGGGGFAELRWLPVFLAGLLDGINPCAFTTLIFMISYLRLIGRKGRDILWIGGSFTLAVFLCYFLIGLGAFQFLRAAASFALIASLIRYVLGTGLLILAVLSLVDFIRVRQGGPADSILQLSTKRKKQIHSTLRNSSRSALLCLSSFGAGFLISLYELGCTGQIYLPMLVYMLKQGQRTALAPLLLYNTAFILPLVAVFLFFYKGSDSDRIGALFVRHLGKIKLATAFLFLGMGLFVLLS
jgi:cytochrome c biogenesis protein CcdA